MSEPKPFASLSPSLLARKGSARPAMRPQIQPMSRFHDAQQAIAEVHQDDDLGWNDMGHDVPVLAAQESADVIPIVEPASPSVAVAPAVVPEIVHQQADIARRIAPAAVAMAPVRAVREPASRRSALADGRRAAFTLRVDADRHLKLRLACTVRNRSAQQLVTEALDRLLDELPELTSLAAQVAGKR